MGSESNGNPNQVNRFFTVILKGGNPFEVFIPASGVVVHNGVHSLHHIFCTQEVLDRVLEMAGGKAEVISEGENEAQREERKLLHRQDLNKIFPTSECGECLWFSLGTDNLCGARDWNDARKKALLDLHSKAIEDILKCPLLDDSTKW